MSEQTLAVTGSGAAYRVVATAETGVHIAIPEAVAATLAAGGRLTDVDTNAGGSIGVTADGRLAYRPAADFVGEERIILRVADVAGREATIVIDATVERGVAKDGWSDGEHYLLAQDADGWSIAEPGENHRKVYVSPDGRATADGLTPETAITPAALQGLLDQLKPVPGSSSSIPAPSSWHVLFERGHYYGTFRPPIQDGEDALHPFVVGAYGVGERPLFTTNLNMFGTGENAIQHYLVRDIAFGYPDPAQAAPGSAKIAGFSILGSGHENILFENIVIEGVNGEPVINTTSSQVTLYRVAMLDGHRVDPVRGDDWSDPIRDRVSGLYADRVDGLLILETLAAGNGWQPGFNPTGAYADAQPPSAFSHNFYIDFSVNNLTFADTVSTGGASFGAQLRSGGAAYGNVFYDNNIAVNMLGGGMVEDGFAGYFGLLLDTVATAPATKTALQIGGRGWGVNLAGPGAAVDVIVAQDGDAPGVATSGATRAFHQSPNDAVDYTTDGVTVFNWGTQQDRILSGADRGAMIATTLDRFAAAWGLADAAALTAALRARDKDDWGDAPDAADIVAWFRDGFGYDPLATAAGRVVSFSADARGEGFRWDNRLNWSDDRAPASGDRVRLDGHDVTYGLQTLGLASLDFGQGGALRVTQAKVETGVLTAGALGGRVVTEGAGQFVFDGYADADLLTLVAHGGRIANTGVVTGGVTVVAREGQLLLGDGDALFSLDAGDALTIDGDDARVGFDGASGDAVLRLAGGTLRFVAEATGFSAIEEFSSGRHGVAAPGVRSVLDLRGGVLEIDLTGYNPLNGRSLTLIDVDAIVGGLGAVQTRIVGVPTGHTARLVVNDAAAAIGVVLDGGSTGGSSTPISSPTQPTPVEGGGSVSAPVQGEIVLGWTPPSQQTAPIVADRFPTLAANWSSAASPKLAVFTAAAGEWRDAADWRGALTPVTGDWVQLQGRTATFDGGVFGAAALNLGQGGRLAVTDGLVDVRALSGDDAAIMLVDGGQFIFNGYGRAAEIEIDVVGGRAVNTGVMNGRLSVTASDGQLVLAEAGDSFDLIAGAALTVRGDDAAVGFDGGVGRSVLRLNGGTLRFEADATGVSTIGEFASGRYGATPQVWSVFDMRAGVIEIDLSAYNPANGLSLTLIDVDEVIGNAQALDVRIIGAPAGYYARVGVNGDLDMLGVTLIPGSPPSGGTGGGAAPTFEPLAVDWSAAGAPKLVQLSGAGTDWGDAVSWVGGSKPALGDWVRLLGHDVRFDDGVFGATAMNLGSGGALHVEGGLIELRGLSLQSNGLVTATGDGQFVFDGFRSSGGLTIDVAGGRVINTGSVTHAINARVSDGELLLGEGDADYRIVTGASLTIVGDDARVGFDGGGGVSTLRLQGGALTFDADSTGVSAITEFSSGRFGAAPNVSTTVILDGGAITVDLSDYDPVNGTSLTLIDVDRIDRGFFGYHQDYEVIGLRPGYTAAFGLDEAAGLLTLELTESLIF
jgi:hypothetical protein